MGRNPTGLPLRRRSLSHCHATHDAVLQDDTLHTHAHMHMPSGPSCHLTEEAEKVNYEFYFESNRVFRMGICVFEKLY